MQMTTPTQNPKKTVRVDRKARANRDRHRKDAVIVVDMQNDFGSKVACSRVRDSIFP